VMPAMQVISPMILIALKWSPLMIAARDSVITSCKSYKLISITGLITCNNYCLKFTQLNQENVLNHIVL